MINDMDRVRIQQIIKLLKTNDDNRVQFEKVREELLGQGYSEKEIVYALYEFPYDGIPNEKRGPNPVEKYFNEHPDEADKVAKDLLHDFSQEEFNKALLYGMASVVASRLGDRQAELNYQVRASDEVGYPFYTIFSISLIVGVLVIKFPQYIWVYAIFGMLANAWFLYLFLKKYLASRKK